VKLLLERLEALELSHGVWWWQSVAAEGQLLVLAVRRRVPEVVWLRIEHTVIVVASVLVEMARWLLLIVELSLVPPLIVSRRL